MQCRRVKEKEHGKKFKKEEDQKRLLWKPTLWEADKDTRSSYAGESILPYAQLGKKIYYRLSDIEVLFQKEVARPKRLKKIQAPKRSRIKGNKNAQGWLISV